MIKTAECVSPRHPDKMCDQISDAILDFYLEKDPLARVAVEVMGGHGHLYVIGEVTCKEKIQAEELESMVGYLVHRITGGADLMIDIHIEQQSKEIANGVDVGGAGDQGIMVGYACTDNEAMIPQEAYLAKQLCKFLYTEYPYDGKTQITMDGDKVLSIVASFQNVKSAVLEEKIRQWITKENPTFVVGDFDKVKIHANPAGDWKIGGFDADTGLTGRKIIVDAYGPNVAVGGGAFSGKDPSKVDRSAAYMARKIAIDTMRQFQAQECLVKLAYAIGVAMPVMGVAYVTKAGVKTQHNLINGESGKYLTPKGIREFLKLDAPQYEATARWGHFGNGEFTWDK